MKSLKLLCPGLFVLAAIAPAQAQTRQPSKPKLTVVIVVDQFRQEYLTRYKKYFGRGGFRYLMDGANLAGARYNYGTTYTGPGHAVISSGSYGHTNGIIGNRWYNPASKIVESMFYDSKAELLGLKASPKDDDTSPRNLIGNTLGDSLRMSSNFRSKVIGISNKDRAAIMLAGKLGRAYWYHEGAGGMTSSTYYGAQLPAWLQAFNARKIPDTLYGQVWNKALPAEAYEGARSDDFPFETDFKNLGKAFPHRLVDPSGKPTADYYEAFTATPWGNDYQLQLARQAIVSEGLGADDHTDLLGMSLTATDIAGHAWGPDSHETADIIVRLDKQLESFINDVNRRVGPNKVLWALTADHGACPLPEYMQTLGMDAGRIKKKQINDAIVAALDARFGKPNGDAKWIVTLEDPGVFLNRDVVADKKLDFALVQRVAGEATLTVPGMAAFYTRDQLQNGQLSNRWASAFERSFFAERSGDVLLQTKPFYFWGSYGERDTGSTHGSPYEYDSRVPFLVRGAGVRGGRYTMPVDMIDFAPTLASLLGITPPAGNEGRAVSEIIMSQ